MAYIQHMLRMKAKSIDPGGIFFSLILMKMSKIKDFFSKSKDVHNTIKLCLEVYKYLMKVSKIKSSNNECAATGVQLQKYFGSSEV